MRIKIEVGTLNCWVIDVYYSHSYSYYLNKYQIPRLIVVSRCTAKRAKLALRIMSRSWHKNIEVREISLTWCGGKGKNVHNHFDRHHRLARQSARFRRLPLQLSPHDRLFRQIDPIFLRWHLLHMEYLY